MRNQRIWGGCHAATNRASYAFVQIHDQVNVARGVTQAGQDSRRLRLVLGPVVDEMCEGFPEHSLMWNSLGGYVFESAVEPLIGHGRHEFHQPGFLVRPASAKRFEGREVLRFQSDRKSTRLNSSHQLIS